MARRPLLCLVVVAIILVLPVLALDKYHPYSNRATPNTRNVRELPSSYWNNNAQDLLRERMAKKLNTNVAKNIILFIGDGMSVQTLAATRTYLGQKEGRTGEESELSFEKFPAAGLVKTYCVNAQIPDSSCTATAYLCGIKNNQGMACLSAEVQRGQCDLQEVEAYQAESIAAWAVRAGKDAGVVTNTRITHASPSAAYAHVAERHWENDAEVWARGGNASVCPDIAHQLIHSFPGQDFKVILGGGRNQFITTTAVDEQGHAGYRTDGRDLIEEWKINQIAKNASHSYVWNREQLLNLDLEHTDSLFGLFNTDHLQYSLRDLEHSEPRLDELTEAAITVLQKNENGFFLFVEGGRIDHAHHDTKAHLALDETLEFHKAVQKAVEMTSEEDTLIVVSSDHSHVMAFNGYAHRGKDVLGLSDDFGQDAMPYFTLSYTNGPGFRSHSSPGIRADVSQMNYQDIEFEYPAEVPLESETHAGEDVAVFARGPFEHMFSGLYEQSAIPHLMAYAACVGPGEVACTSAANLSTSLSGFTLALITISIKLFS